MNQVAYFDSHNLLYKRPFGAVSTGTEVKFALKLEDVSLHPRLRLWVDDAERLVEGRRKGESVEFTFVPESEGLVWYYFILEGEAGRKWLGPAKPGLGGPGQLYDYEPPSWQLTVYAPGFETPQFVKEGIIYQVFPDRFAKLPYRLDCERYAHHEKMGRPLYIHESWDEEPLYRPLPGAEDYNPCDFFGGDLEGLISRIPHIRKLGASCIYLNPVFESPSNHRYDTADYMAVDPILGGDAALKDLARMAGDCGIKLMLDGVFSHTGADSRYFDIRGTYGGGAAKDADSVYRNWYEFRSWPDSYSCWWGFRSLPEVRELEPSYMEYIGSVIDRYAKMGITSWRLDVADELPDEFIEFLRGRIKKNDPDGLLLGEVWEDASNKISRGARRRYVDGHELDSVMNYPFRDALVDFMLMRTDGAGLALRFESLRENMPEPFYLACMNLLGSHDTPRILTVLSGAPSRDALTREEQAEYKLRPEMLARGRAREIMCLMIQMAYPGVPSVYYGDEAGMTGMADPFNRATYPWGREDEHMLSRYELICGARQKNRAMGQGLCGFAAPDEDVFVMLRCEKEDCALVAVNRSEQAKHVTVSAEMFEKGPDRGKLFIAPKLKDVLTDTVVETKNGAVNFILPPLSGALLLNENE